ncbi:uncharacterized protein [Solanum lycopersicum]|uniref:uncharacterized protein n=1 Tax=Solanum lycopersicum TaxID=4081 RepID=UPI0037499AE5
MELKESVIGKINDSFSLVGDGVLRSKGRLCVPNVDDLRNQNVEEAYGSRYSIHPGSIKMYHDLREVFWWEGMKGDIEELFVKCPNCEQVKVEKQKPSHDMEVGIYKHGFLGIMEDLSNEKVPAEIFDRQVNTLRNKEVSSVKVLWKNHLVKDATWKVEAYMNSHYPHLFDN